MNCIFSLTYYTEVFTYLLSLSFLLSRCFLKYSNTRRDQQILRISSSLTGNRKYATQGSKYLVDKYLLTVKVNMKIHNPIWVILVPSSVRAVSYTHLDVYKRQTGRSRSYKTWCLILRCRLLEIKTIRWRSK